MKSVRASVLITGIRIQNTRRRVTKSNTRWILRRSISYSAGGGLSSGRLKVAKSGSRKWVPVTRYICLQALWSINCSTMVPKRYAWPLLASRHPGGGRFRACSMPVLQGSDPTAGDLERTLDVQSLIRARKFMKERSLPGHVTGARIVALMTAFLISTPAVAQMDIGPKTEKSYGIGLPRDHASQLFKDADYPGYALKPGQEAYQGIDRARMKKDVIALSKIALNYRDTVNRQWWGRFPGTDADKAGVKYMTDEFTRLGLTVKSFP